MRKQLALLMGLACLCVQSVAQKQLFTGTVQDPAGIPVFGASVNIKGTQSGTVTDDEGKFAISAASGSALIISAVGYETTEIEASVIITKLTN